MTTVHRRPDPALTIATPPPQADSGYSDTARVAIEETAARIKDWLLALP